MSEHWRYIHAVIFRDSIDGCAGRDERKVCSPARREGLMVVLLLEGWTVVGCPAQHGAFKLPSKKRRQSLGLAARQQAILCR